MDCSVYKFSAYCALLNKKNLCKFCQHLYLNIALHSGRLKKREKHSLNCHNRVLNKIHKKSCCSEGLDSPLARGGGKGVTREMQTYLSMEKA